MIRRVENPYRVLVENHNKIFYEEKDLFDKAGKW